LHKVKLFLDYKIGKEKTIFFLYEDAGEFYEYTK